MPLPFARIVPFPGPFSQDRVHMNVMQSSKWLAPFSSSWSINAKNRLPLCNDDPDYLAKCQASLDTRANPDSFGYVWTGKFDSKTLRLDAETFKSAKKSLRIQTYPDVFPLNSIAFRFGRTNTQGL